MASNEWQGRSAVAVMLPTSTPKATRAMISCVTRAVTSPKSTEREKARELHQTRNVHIQPRGVLAKEKSGEEVLNATGAAGSAYIPLCWFDGNSGDGRQHHVIHA